MNWKYRIATLLIMLAPGIFGIPGARAVGDGEDSVATYTSQKEPVKFKGYRITTNPAEYLLMNAAQPEDIQDAKEDISNDVRAQEESMQSSEPPQTSQQVLALRDEKTCSSKVICKTLLIIKH